MMIRVFGSRTKKMRYIQEFELSKRNPLKVQHNILQRILTHNKNTVFGKKHGFSTITSIEEFQKKVPINSYADIQPYIERCKLGEQNILTKDKILFFATSSGTTSAPKFIPITKERMRIFKGEFALWFLKFLKEANIKSTKGKMLYFATAGKLGTTKAHIPYGNITGYMVQKLPAMLKKKMVLDARVYNINDVEKRTKTIAILALQENVTQLAFFAPIEAILFFDYLQENREELTSLVAKKNKKRAKQLASLPDFKPIHLWPKLAMINCVKTPSTQIYLQQLYSKIGKKIPTKDPGIYASEGRINLGIVDDDKAGVLMANTNFFEFCEQTPSGFKEPVTINNIKQEKKYKVIITTAEGLYRYDLKDIVKVVGFKKKLPVVEFFDRDNYINIIGENMSEIELVKAVQTAMKKENLNATGFSATPFIKNAKEKPCYEILFEPKEKLSDTQAKKFLKLFEKELQQNVLTYKKARNEFGRMNHPQLSIVKKESYKKLTKDKMKTQTGQIKPFAVSKDPSFRKKFTIEKTITIT